MMRSDVIKLLKEIICYYNHSDERRVATDEWKTLFDSFYKILYVFDREDLILFNMYLKCRMLFKKYPPLDW